MELENESTSESEDETDSYSLQYQEVDPSLLGTAVFIRKVQVDPGDLVLLYVHKPETEEKNTPDYKLAIIVIGALLAISSMIILSL